MRSQLGDTFRTLDLTGQVVARSKTAVMVEFGQIGFLSVVTECQGSYECLITLALPREILAGSDIEELTHDVLKFFDIRLDMRCHVRTCEPVKLARAPFYAKAVESPFPSVYAAPPTAIRSPPTAIPQEKIYSVPRRYDLASMFSISIAYATLFASMRALDSPPALTLLAGGFFAVVGISQALLFHGKKPRGASIVSGTIYCFFGMILLGTIEGGNPASIAAGSVCSLFWSPVAGYLAGTCIGGIWLVADYLRQWMEKRYPGSTGTDAGGASTDSGKVERV